MMAHRVYTGSFDALENRFLEVIVALQKDDPLAPVSILVGSNILASYLKFRIADERRAAANLRFYTFLDLVLRFGSLSRARSPKPRLPPLGASWILANLLDAETPDPFKQVAGYTGFRGAVLDTFRDLRDAGITPGELEQAMRWLAKKVPDRKQHLQAVAELYRRFRERVELFWDVDDDFREAIHNGPEASKLLGTGQLLIYGLYDVTGQQADLLSNLKNTLELFYFIPYVDDSASLFAKRFVQERAQELGVSVEALASQERRDSLGALVPRIFATSSGGSRLKADGTFALVSVPGESRSAVEIVREILRAVHDGVITGFHEAAVILRHTQNEIPVLAEAFRLRQIPYFVHGGSSFAQRPLSRAVMAIASLEGEAFSRQAVLRAMELVAAALPEKAAKKWDAPRWHALTNDPIFLAGTESWNKGTEALIVKARQELAKAKARDRSPAEEGDDGRWLSLTQAEERLEATETLRAGWVALRRAAADWPASLAWQGWAKLLEEEFQPLLESAEDWAAFCTVLDDLSSLNEVAGIAGLPVQVYRVKANDALQDSLQNLSHPEGRFQRNGVNILSITAARGLRFPLVIVPGLDEGKFPARLRQDPLLLDRERQKIGNSARLPLKSERFEEEKLLFDMTVRSAQGRLILLTSRLDESSDRERIPSDFFLRAAAAAQGSIVGLRDLSGESVPGLRGVTLDRPAPKPDEILVDNGEVRLRLITSNPQPAQVLEAMAAEEPFRLAGPRAFDRARWQRRLTGFDGRLYDPELARWVAERQGAAAGQVSASRLEDYAKCPYLFFLKRVMELETWEEVEPSEGMDPPERGRVVHHILESFLKEFRGEKLVHTPVEELQGFLDVLARDRLESARPAGIPDLLWEIERDGLLCMLRNWLTQERERIGEGFLPVYLEHPFGDLSSKEQAAPYQVRAGKYIFSFRGKIDRIDLTRDRMQARVVDYKIGNLQKTMTGKQRPVLMGGERMQIAIYRGALSALPEFAGVVKAEGEYLFLQPKDGRTIPCSYDADVLRKEIEALPEILEIVGEGIEGGVFFARTSGNVFPQGHCKYCDYLTVCGKDRIQREERKSGDDAVSRFGQMSQKDGGSEEEE